MVSHVTPNLNCLPLLYLVILHWFTSIITHGKTLVMSTDTPQEFPITRGMLAQYKLSHHGLIYKSKPLNVFEQCYGALPGYTIPSMILSVHEEIPKYVLHVVDAFTIHHPKMLSIKTRYLKCFVTIPQLTNKRSFHLSTEESETTLGYVRDEWVEPLIEDQYSAIAKKSLREIKDKFLEKLKSSKT